MENWLKVEFHCHSSASRDSLNRPADLVATARRRGLGRLMVTDHNTIKGALEAHQLDPELVVVGEEILTLDGELLAYYVKEEIPRGMVPEDAIGILRQQGAFISIPHPFDRGRHGWELEDLERIVPLVDAIEVFNSRSHLPLYNDQAAAFARAHSLAVTVGSDAHTLDEIGRSNLALPPFTNADELRQVIRQGIPETRISSPSVHFYSFWARMVKGFSKHSPN